MQQGHWNTGVGFLEWLVLSLEQAQRLSTTIRDIVAETGNYAPRDDMHLLTLKWKVPVDYVIVGPCAASPGTLSRRATAGHRDYLPLREFPMGTEVRIVGSVTTRDEVSWLHRRINGPSDGKKGGIPPASTIMVVPSCCSGGLSYGEDYQRMLEGLFPEARLTWLFPPVQDLYFDITKHNFDVFVISLTRAGLLEVVRKDP